MTDVVRIIIEERKGIPPRPNTFDVRHESASGSARPIEWRRTYREACELAAERCQGYGFATYQSSLFTSTPYTYCIATIDAHTGETIERHEETY